MEKFELNLAILFLSPHAVHTDINLVPRFCRKCRHVRWTDSWYNFRWCVIIRSVDYTVPATCHPCQKHVSVAQRVASSDLCTTTGFTAVCPESSFLTVAAEAGRGVDITVFKKNIAFIGEVSFFRVSLAIQTISRLKNDGFEQICCYDLYNAFPFYILKCFLNFKTLLL